MGPLYEEDYGPQVPWAIPQLDLRSLEIAWSQMDEMNMMDLQNFLNTFKHLHKLSLDGEDLIFLGLRCLDS